VILHREIQVRLFCGCGSFVWMCGGVAQSVESTMKWANLTNGQSQHRNGAGKSRLNLHPSRFPVTGRSEEKQKGIISYSEVCRVLLMDSVIQLTANRGM